jgi:GNAT superfamily N-acetyltransferase
VTIELSDARYGDALTAALVEEIQQEMIARYGGPDETPVDPAQFAAPGGAFLVAHVDGEPIGCAGLRGRPAGEVELKRLYVRPAHRRRGYARGLLLAVEDRARSLGYRRLVLETGTAQPEAIALYEKAGYSLIPDFGHYKGYPSVRSFGRSL